MCMSVPHQKVSLLEFKILHYDNPRVSALSLSETTNPHLFQSEGLWPDSALGHFSVLSRHNVIIDSYRKEMSFFIFQLFVWLGKGCHWSQDAFFKFFLPLLACRFYLSFAFRWSWKQTLGEGTKLSLEPSLWLYEASVIILLLSAVFFPMVKYLHVARDIYFLVKEI